jgi:hypothetical protein
MRRYGRARRRGNPAWPCSAQEEGTLKRLALTIGTISVLFAALWFVSGAVRMGFMVARANIGLYEAVFVAVIGLVLILFSRRS